MAIEIAGITKIYGSQKALDNVSFRIPTGQIVGFLGPNGAGKTTLMKIITGFIPPTSGQVKVNNLDVVSHSLEVRKITGYLPENNPLYLEMYITEYLEFVGGIYGMKGTSLQNRIREVIKLTGLKAEQTKKIGALSKGYRQRVGLAQAIIHNPEILILDEPTSGLDPNQIIEIRQFISELGKEKTVLLSTHIMQEVEAICNHIVIINKGKIVADKSAAEIHQSRLSSRKSLHVEFDSDVDKTLIQNIPGIIKAEKTKTNCWVLSSNSDFDIRPKVFDFAVNNNIKVLSITEKEKSIEEVFQELTAD
jgi:ABC-2 type transport system ATP-binding protein